jgi:REP element-mobilizing transposase RayT
MPDHIHAFVSAGGSEILSHWTGSLKKFLAAHWRRQGYVAPFWQQGFFDHLLRSGESYQTKWMYVFQNPVRAGLINDAHLWLFAGEVHPIELSEGQRRADSQSRPTTRTGANS